MYTSSCRAIDRELSQITYVSFVKINSQQLSIIVKIKLKLKLNYLTCRFVVKKLSFLVEIFCSILIAYNTLLINNE